MASSILPPTSALVEEALREAVEHKTGVIIVRTFTAEHLAAIPLETGRAKDKARILQFLDDRALDMRRLEAILTQNGLVDRWRQFERQFLS